MLTFTDQVNIATGITGLNDSSSLTTFKRDINHGGTKFLAVLGRPWDRMSRFTNLTSSQQYYQLPEDALRVSDVVCYNGTTWQPLLEVTDENQWRMMNQTVVSGRPSHFFVKGNDEIGLYPVPSSTVSAGLELVFEPKHVLLTQDDFTTGSVTVTNNSQAVAHSAAGFTTKMAGQYLTTTDGSDGLWYRIASVTDASNLTLENFYQGPSGSVSFRIGQVMYMPEEFQEAPVDYAMYRYFLARGDLNQANEFKSVFEAAIEEAKNLYGQSSSNQIVDVNKSIRLYNPLLDTPTINL